MSFFFAIYTIYESIDGMKKAFPFTDESRSIRFVDA
jgi:hypothetical protein